MTARHEPLDDLDRRWTEAEVGGDAATLDGLATDDFTLVGPAGFVLSKQQWLDRYRDGDLRMRAPHFEEAVTRVYGDTAVTIGRQIQEADSATVRSTASSASRASLCATAPDGGWRGCTSVRSPVRPRAPGARRDDCDTNIDGAVVP
jgi:hypothetical protein